MVDCNRKKNESRKVVPKSSDKAHVAGEKFSVMSSEQTSE